MKRVIFLNGSPRKKGNTSIMIQHLKNLLPASKFETEVSYLYDYNIKPCNDCRACKKGELVCPVKDDMQVVYPKLNDADYIVFGTPIYWFGPTATMKSLIDRFRPYYVNKRLQDKKAALLLPAGTGDQDTDLTIELFNRTFEALGIELMEAVSTKAYDEGEVYDDELAMEKIERLSAQIN
jgi:multimeric flavodoxin WrbA